MVIRCGFVGEAISGSSDDGLGINRNRTRSGLPHDISYIRRQLGLQLDVLGWLAPCSVCQLFFAA
jgi:hypothetical protein